MNGWQRFVRVVNEAVSGVVKLVQSLRGTGGRSEHWRKNVGTFAGTEAKVGSNPIQQPGPDDQDSSLSFYYTEVVCISTSQKSPVDP